MIPTTQNTSGRPSCALASIITASLALSSAHAIDPEYRLVNSEVGVVGESVTAEGYPDQHRIMVGGLCVGDFNSDTYPDIFVPSLGRTPNKLFINNQDGTFTEQAEQWGVSSVHLGAGVAAADVNNDGHTDLYVVSYGPPGLFDAGPGMCVLYLNSGPDHNGNHTFTDIAVQAGVNSVLSVEGGMTPAFGDVDLDGDLDLFVATWRFAPGGNRLFENQFMQTGKAEFIDVTTESMSPPARFDITRGFTPHIVDITGDRYPEILLTADFSSSELYTNNGPDESGRISYRTTTTQSNISADHNGMGAAVADFDNDGLLDWFQTNIFVAQEEPFGNTLYMGQGTDENGDPIFQDQAPQRAVQDIGWGWGVVAGDFDNDTDPDLIATNGWPGWPNEITRFWANNGIGNFLDRSSQAGLLFNVNGRGLVSLDHDKDGDLDLVFVDNQGPLRFYRNEMSVNEGFSNYLRVRLDTSTHPCLAPDGMGAKVYATTSGLTRLHAVHNNASYLSQSELTTHIGLAFFEQVDELRIEWADGSTTTLNNIPANQEITVNAYHPADVTQDAHLDFLDANAFIHAYYAGGMLADFDKDGTIEDQDVFDFLDAFNNACAN